MIGVLSVVFITVLAFVAFAAGCAWLTDYVRRRVRKQQEPQRPHLRLVHARKDN